MFASHSPLAALLLAGGALLASPSPLHATPIDGGEAQQASEDSRVVQLKLAGRKLMERVAEHRERLRRLDNLVHYHRARGHHDQVRQLEALRRREIAAFEQSLAEMRRLLGGRDFERLSRAVRFLTTPQGVGGETSASETARTASRDTSAGVRRANALPSFERSLDRQIALERARASRRMQLAQRLQQATEQQRQLMAEQQRRLQPAPAPASRPGATRGSGQGTSPSGTRPDAGRRQAPPRRRP